MPTQSTARWPIDALLPQLRAALRDQGAAVLVAPPGSGKSTRVPLALLDEPWLAGRRVLLLEPRRLAARAIASFMARQLGEPVGQTVGYRIRLDTRVGPQTRLEVITEGILTRLLQADPTLEGVGLIIFDEFHERSLHVDLGLALALQSRNLVRDDLRLLVMSATLDPAPVAALLGDAPVLHGEGEAYPVATFYLERPHQGPVEPLVARTIREALRQHEGDILAFLPGAAEIRTVARQLAAAALGPEVLVLPLHGNLAAEAQERALAPAPPGRRKVVLATSIAETSLTVPGVRVVVDSGLMRVPRFSPRTGLTRLETVRVSRASADQRRGRAGRLGPGVCYRLWTAEEDRLLPPPTPEILAVDLAELALQLAAWGTPDPGELAWLTPPPAASYRQACQLLTQLGALDHRGHLTPHGRRLAALGAHPRLAQLMLGGQQLGRGRLACLLAALLSERDILRGAEAPLGADLELRLTALLGGSPPPGTEPDTAACRRIWAQADLWCRELGIPAHEPLPAAALGELLLLAFPDRVAQRRGAGRFLLRNGRGATLPLGDPLSSAPYLVVAELDDAGSDARILRAASLEREALERHLGDQIEEEEVVAWDAAGQALRARRLRRLGALVLQEAPLPRPSPAVLRAAWLETLRRQGLGLLPWTRSARELQQRVCFLARLEPGWPDLSEAALLQNLDEWLGPYLEGRQTLPELQELDLTNVLRGLLTPQQVRALEEAAPTHITLPSGARLRVDYSDPEAPVLAVRVQQLFGCPDTPTVGRGRVPLTLHLLSPAGRPVQVTRDLASFWRHTYPQVRKDLRGRYPKHPWPEDPWQPPAPAPAEAAGHRGRARRG